MTLCLGLNANNDIYRGPDGNVALLGGLQAVLTACETASKSQLGEMVLSIGRGIPNMQAMWKGVPNIAIWQAYLRKMLLAVDGVTQVQNIQFRKAGDVFSYTATIKTPYGVTTVTG